MRSRNCSLTPRLENDSVENRNLVVKVVSTLHHALEFDQRRSR